MGAIFGIVGEGWLAEVRAMGQVVSHRGRSQHVEPRGRTSISAGRNTGRSRRTARDDGRLARGRRRGALAERVRPEGPPPWPPWGSFAVAICGGPAQLSLAVNQIGFKSLYYSVLRGRFAFASEYKSLLAFPTFRSRPEPAAIQHYLATKYPLGGRSFLARARTLQGGNLLKLRDKRIVVSTTEFGDRRRQPFGPGARAVVRDALLETVHRQVHPYEAGGHHLGGGVDAAIVLGAIRRVAPDMRISSFTIGAAEDDSEVWAPADRRQFGADPRVPVRSVDDPRSSSELVWLTEDCGSRGSDAADAVLRHAGEHAKVVFGGHGRRRALRRHAATPADRSRRAAADVQRAAAGAVSRAFAVWPRPIQPAGPRAAGRRVRQDPAAGAARAGRAGEGIDSPR